MASTSKPKIRTFIAGGTIAHGHAVKFGADHDHVVECTSSTDQSIGLAQCEQGSVANTEKVEVALPGGGAKAAAHGTITAGEQVVPYTDGTLQKTTGANDRVIGIAMDSAVAGDIFEVHVSISQATTTET